MKTMPFPEFTDHEALPCLPRTMSAWAIRRRCRRPIHTGASCCWYHGGSWTSACHLARDIVLSGQKRGFESEELGEWASELVDRTDWLTGWKAEAIQSLVSVESAIVIEHDEDEGFWISEGRHRLAAMFHTGAAQFDLIDPTTGKPVND